MKKKIVMSFAFVLAIMFSFSFVFAQDSSDSMTVRVSVIESSVGISVPENVIFNNIAPGYLSERHDLEIVNIGTVDVEVTPELSSANPDDVFNNLVFQDTLSAPMDPLGVFKIDISRASYAGETRSENIYMYLDLTNYNSTGELLNHEAEVIFWATAK